MANYLLKKDKITNLIINMEYNFDGYEIIPKHKERYLNIEKLVIINPILIEKIVTQKFNQTFRKLAFYILMVINDDEATGTDTIFALGEIEKTRGILLNKYQKFLNSEIEKEYLDKLRYLENQVRIKQIEIRQKEYFYDEEKFVGHSR